MGYGLISANGKNPEMIAMGVLDLRKFSNHYLKLQKI
ncbi:MAG: crossover junction endodeoxyribonuclease RuvC, partial [Bacteroidales bacterium]|nr:crossover junction endodeoxyribonuclease RuvC [Bacteroidales bacterium]